MQVNVDNNIITCKDIIEHTGAKYLKGDKISGTEWKNTV